MARKSDATKASEPAPAPKAKAAPKKKAAAPKKDAAPPPAPAAEAPAKAPKTKVAVKKAAAPIKLTEKQVEFLKTIRDAGAGGGYLLSKKAEQRTIDALLDRKLIKRGPKDKESGNYRYSVSKAGEKHLSTI